MARNWTRDQKNAIAVRDKRILVSAAAGSGKTAVLVERIIGRILDEKNPVDVDELLVMTFTRAAAAEMRERIYKSIEEEIFAETPGTQRYERLKRQAALIEHARIMTIDSFCLSLIREHINMLNLDPAFRIAGEGETDMLKDEVLEEILEERYGNKDEDFLEFVDSFAKSRSDIRIVEFIESLFNFVQSHPWPEKLLKDILEEYEKGGESKNWEVYILKEIRRIAEEIQSSIENAIDICDEPGGPTGYRETFSYELEEIKTLAKADSFQKIQAALADFDFPNIGRVTKDTDAALKEKAKRIRDDYKKMIRDVLAKNFRFDPKRLEKENFFEKKIVGILVELVRDYMQRFAARKLEKNIADFNDLEHFALEILWVEGKRSEAAIEYAKLFKEIYVDEYQDSNEVQEEIIRAIESNNVFMVGDVKQSIYAFRQAKPDLFIAKYKSYPLLEEDTQSDTELKGENIKINLKQNFRSRESVLHTINSVFYRIMSPGLGGIEYNKDAALYKGKDYPESPAGGENMYNSELLLCSQDEMEQEESRREVEARMIAGRIRELMSPESGFLVEDKEGGYRALRYSDIVILLRAMTGWAESFVDILSAEGIPAYAQTSTGYFDTVEVRQILALLAVIDNPYQDIEFAAFLRSPIIDMDETGISQIKSFFRQDAKISEKRIHFYEISEYVLEHEEAKEYISRETLLRLQKARYILKKYRAGSKYMKLSELLRDIYNETGYLDYVSAMNAGEIRRANLMMLLDKAVEYGNTGYRGLFNFIRYIDNLQKYDTDYGEASILGESDDTVRIMSIHKSKGLEFPVCFIGGMGKQFNMMDQKTALIVDEELGIACDYVDSESRIKWSSLKKNIIKHRKRSELLGEELRVLYVAMSRAREKLIMTAAVSDANKVLEKYLQLDSLPEKSIPSIYLQRANSYLDWIMMCREGIEKDMDIKLYNQSELLGEEEEKQRKSMFLEKEFEDMELPEDLSLKEVLEKPYPYSADIELYTKMTVSELKAMKNDREEDIPLLFLPSDGKDSKIRTSEEEITKRQKLPEKKEFSYRDKKAGYGTGRGNAYHRVLELMDYTKVYDKESLLAFLDGLEKEGKIDNDEKALIDTGEMMHWINSELAKKFRLAQEEGRLYREVRFIMGVPANELGISESTQSILVQGIIDAYIEDESSFIIVDYKTDRVKNAEDLKFRYGKQLKYYKEALSKIIKKPLETSYIWSFTLHRAITCEKGGNQL